MPRSAGDRVAVDGTLAQNVEHHRQHQQREDGHTALLVAEDDENDILQHDQHGEKRKNQKVQHVMHAADALLLVLIVGVHIRTPVGRKPCLNGGDQLRQAVPEGEQPLRGGVAVVADKGQADAAGQAEQNLRRCQRHAVRHGDLGDAAQRVGGQGCQRGAAVLVPKGDGDHAKAQYGCQRQQIYIGSKKARQQVKQVEAALHPQGFGGVGADVVFQTQQNVQIPHQHIQRGVDEQQRHNAGTGAAKTQCGCQGAGKKHAAADAQHQRKRAGNAGAGGKQLVRLGPGGRLVIKAQQRLIQTQDAKVHHGGGVGHKGHGGAQRLGGQKPLDDQRHAGNDKAQIGGDGVFHHVAGKGFAGRFFGISRHSEVLC